MAAADTSPAPSGPEGGREYLCYFLHRHLSFRQAEVEALASAAGAADVTWRPPVGGSFFSPFWYVRLPGDATAQAVAARSMLVKGFYEVWGEGACFEELAAALQQLPPSVRGGWCDGSHSWKIIVDSWGRTMKLAEQVALINRLAFLDFKGPISLHDADVTFRLIITADKVHNGLPEGCTPVRWYFCRQVAASDRTVISRYGLPQRAYIGPTSMDTEMAFIMCSMARVRRGDLVYDPFVGTGSILVAASHVGARCLGADIDIKVVREGKLTAKGEVRDNWANFRQYGLEPPAGLLRADAHVPPFRQLPDGFLDAVLCDPPYGVRAGGRRSFCLSETGELSAASQRRAAAVAAGKPVSEEFFPPTTGYSLSECLTDLLAFSARHLRQGGRLVYFLPAAPGACEGGGVPQHPALKLVSNCEQVLTRRYSRRLVTMEKATPFDAAAPVPPIDPEIEAGLARLHETVYEPREEAAAKAKYRGKVC